MTTTAVVAALQAQVDHFMSYWQDDTAQLGGWLHDYYCDADGAELTFDITRPHFIQCPVCGRIYTDEARDNAWVGLLRKEAVQTLGTTVLLYHVTGAEKNLAQARQLLFFYAEHYVAFPTHIKSRRVDYALYEQLRAKRPVLPDAEKLFEPETYLKNISIVGPGKMLSQGLDDAVALIQMALATYFLADALDDAERDYLNAHLFVPAKNYLECQQFAVHNITLWREVAIQVLNLVTGASAEFSLDRELGIFDHLRLGLTADSWWYEGSFHYDFYVAEALTYLTLMMRCYHVTDARLEQALAQMLTFPITCAFADGTLPNPNDGWPNITLATYEGVYDKACLSYPADKNFAALHAAVSARKNNNEAAAPMAGLSDFGHVLGLLLLAEKNNVPAFTADTSSANFPSSHLKILQNEHLKTVIKYGVLTTNHAHCDTLSYEFYLAGRLICKDLSNSGYGSKLSSAWYQTALAHNTLLINGDQNLHQLYTVTVTENSPENFEVVTDQLYEKNLGATLGTFKRRFTALANGLRVESTGASEAQDRLSLLQHFDFPRTSLRCDKKMVSLSVDELTERSGIEFAALYLKDAEEIAAVGQSLTLNFATADQNFTAEFSLATSTNVFLLTTFGNPASDDRLTLLFQTSGPLNVTMTFTA